ncbi:MAG: 16S rRNA (cytidine(1402)-2'-O)-methyltransferase [Armatimonadota bacterium]
MGAGGTLYLVATPIGNLEDLTLRAIRVLREASLIACEDTRRTRGLLAHHDIHTPVTSLHEHNERARIPHLLKILQEGKSVAVVSDAGTPAVSDPGAALVAAAARGNCAIVAVPGPSAVTAAVALADFPAGAFAFVGFPPRRSSERRRFLSALAGLPMALVMFEAPHRVHETLSDIEDILGPRRLLLARELTKMHEEILRGTPAEVRAALASSPRGEVTLVIEGAPAAERGAAPPALTPEAFVKRLRAEGLSRRDTARALAAAYQMRARDAYRLTTEET